MKRNLIILIISILLSGCAHMEYEDSTLRPERVYRNKMGMIITEIKVPYKSVLNQPGSYNGYMILRNINTNVKYKVNGATYGDSVSMLIPGIYQIDMVGWDDGAYVYSFKVSGPKIHKINFRFGAFEIKPGECLYLGDIIIDKKSSSIERQINIINRSRQMINSLDNDSAQQFRSRIKFYSLITDRNLISKNSNGQYVIYEGTKND